METTCREAWYVLRRNPRPRQENFKPCDVALNLVANSRHLNVGEVYDILVECELAGSADLL